MSCSRWWVWIQLCDGRWWIWTQTSALPCPAPTCPPLPYLALRHPAPLCLSLLPSALPPPAPLSKVAFCPAAFYFCFCPAAFCFFFWEVLSRLPPLPAAPLPQEVLSRLPPLPAVSLAEAERPSALASTSSPRAVNPLSLPLLTRGGTLHSSGPMHPTGVPTLENLYALYAGQG